MLISLVEEFQAKAIRGGVGEGGGPRFLRLPGKHKVENIGCNTVSSVYSPLCNSACALQKNSGKMIGNSKKSHPSRR